MPFLEAWRDAGLQAVSMHADRITIGKSSTNDLALIEDQVVSRLHAVLERFGAGWSIRDLGSRNGTFVNGERISREHALRPGDEIRIGRTRFVFKSEPSDVMESSPTEGAQAPPELTRRERDILLELCRPVLSGNVFNEPATVREIAERLVVTEAAVKQHLTNLYDKFQITEGGRRRVDLANEAVKRGAVSFAGLRPIDNDPSVER
jgi:hypothetical protein